MSEKFWDKMAESYSKQALSDEESYRKKVEITRQYFNPDMEVLEIGCGTGSTAIAHAPFVKRIQASDISSKMIEIAKEKAVANNIENVLFEKSSVEKLAFTDDSFDVVMGHSVLHLLNDKDAVISKVHRMLKREGVFISSTICIGDSILFKIIRIFVSVGAYFGLLPMVNSFTDKELLASLSNAGFTIEQQWQPKKNSALFVVAKKI